ncbi:ABC transporter permease [Bosea sp. BK604]|uniref:ABC transporter permease n=1 Tax=Bosea sp. BK604 TaxID=2512180 RepID=UPI001046F75C|nr:ABC transporter permease [Bosea sp. BK604]TCR62514.1 peptide/nickel transport system permease protein [Bosea sp. BK604]
MIATSEPAKDVAATPAIGAAPEPSRVLAVLRALLRHRLGRIGAIGLSLLLFCAAFAPLLAPFDPAEIDYEALLEGPSWHHWFGTDELGRDVLSRVLYGSQTSLQVMALAISGALLIGVTLGIVSGFLRGWFDDVAMRVVDGLLAFPTIILSLAIVAALGPSLTNAIIAIAIVNVPDFARLVRGEVISVRELEYVQAARAIGMTNARILWKHVWPNVRGSVIIYASLKAAAAIITESALSFLGLGVQPPDPTWGSMLSTAMQYSDAWWISIFPGLAIFITVLSLNLLGDGLRDVLDART